MKTWLVAMLIIALPGTSHAADPFAAARVSTLPNGLTIVLLPDTTARSVALGVWVRAGSRHESAGTTGVTHLIERLMFAGTARYGPGEYARRVQSEGGGFGAFTGADQTCFESVVPPEGLGTVLRLEADRFGAQVIPPGALERAKRAVQDERRGRADQTPVGRALRQLYATAYPHHPYRFPAVGMDEDLDRLTLAQLRAYRAARYVPSRMLVTLAGRFDPTAALAAVTRSLGALPRATVVADRPPSAPSPGEHRSSMAGEGQAPVVAVGWRTPPESDPDRPVLEVLARVMASGARSRVQQALVRVEDPPCSNAQGGLDARALGGLLYVVASPVPGVDTSRVEGAIEALAAGFVREPVTEEELDAAKRQIEADMLFSWQTPGGVGRAAGASWLAGGDPRGPARVLLALAGITAADVQRVASRVLVPAGHSVVIMTPTRRPEEARR